VVLDEVGSLDVDLDFELLLLEGRRIGIWSIGYGHYKLATAGE